MGSCHPTTAFSSEPIHEAGRPTPASAPLSGFLNLSAVFANSSSTALFHAATVRGLIPSEPSPRRDRDPSRDRPTPLQLSTGRSSQPWTGPYCLRFPRRPRFRRSCLVPPTTMGSLSTHRSALPDHPGSPTPVGLLPQLHLLRSLKSPCESVRTDTSHPAPPAGTLLGFIPFREPSKVSELQTRVEPRREPRTRPHPEAQACDPRDSSPWNRVRPPQRTSTTGWSRQQHPALFRTGPRHLSVTTPSPPALVQRTSRLP